MTDAIYTPKQIAAAFGHSDGKAVRRELRGLAKAGIEPYSSHARAKAWVFTQSQIEQVVADVAKALGVEVPKLPKPVA